MLRGSFRAKKGVTPPYAPGRASLRIHLLRLLHTRAIVSSPLTNALLSSLAESKWMQIRVPNEANGPEIFDSRPCKVGPDKGAGLIYRKNRHRCPGRSRRNGRGRCFDVEE
ncbi:hypothetical protein KM043_002591 [Ampulex compressa]|nr:hypothetical protein KM043_002591 [Ampulex compressa]